MAEYLETTVDKFTFRVAKDRLYTPDGLWIFPPLSDKPHCVRVGVTDFLQQRNGDVAFAKLKSLGTGLKAGDEFAELETMKVNLGLPSPVTGTLVETNKVIEKTPEIINQDPYEKGWLALIEVADWEADRAKFLDAQAYLAVMQSQAEEEVK